MYECLAFYRSKPPKNTAKYAKNSIDFVKSAVLIVYSNISKEILQAFDLIFSQEDKRRKAHGVLAFSGEMWYTCGR